MSVHSYFPTFVYRASLASSLKFNEQLLRECYVFRELDEAGCSWSNRHYAGGYTSYASLENLPERSPTFARLRRLIDGHARKFTRHLEMDIQGRGLVMNSCWINIMPYRTAHGSHLHPLSTLSGTYYVKVGRGSGGLKLEDPRLTGFMGAPPKRPGCSVKNRHFIELRPRAGEVVLFESWLRHEVPANLGKGDRVSISFNYDYTQRP